MLTDLEMSQLASLLASVGRLPLQQGRREPIIPPEPASRPAVGGEAEEISDWWVDGFWAIRDGEDAVVYGPWRRRAPIVAAAKCGSKLLDLILNALGEGNNPKVGAHWLGAVKLRGGGGYWFHLLNMAWQV